MRISTKSHLRASTLTAGPIHQSKLFRSCASDDRAFMAHNSENASFDISSATVSDSKPGVGDMPGNSMDITF